MLIPRINVFDPKLRRLLEGSAGCGVALRAQTVERYFTQAFWDAEVDIELTPVSMKHSIV